MTTEVPLLGRINTPISDEELERRWSAVRSKMTALDIDVLVVQGNNDHMGGYVKWLSDIPGTNGYPLTLVFPRSDPMTVVMHGPAGGDRTLEGETDGYLRGVVRVLTTPSLVSASYTREYDAELASDALEPYASETVGVVGSAQMSSAFLDCIRRRLPRAKFVEASDLVDEIRMIKSPEELRLIRRTAELQDEAMQAAMRAIAVGVRESDVAAAAQYASQQLGSEQGVYLTGSAAVGQPITLMPRHLQDRRLAEGDVLFLLIENNGPGGMYAELGRVFVLGDVSEALAEEFAFVLEAQRRCVSWLRPGALCAEVWEAYNELLREHGRPEERRLHCHGQGYDLVERPLIRHDEPAAIKGDMNIACHPLSWRGGAVAWICDNFFVHEDGPAERVHRFPQEIVRA